MELKELMKLAGQKPAVRDAIVKLACALTKKAQSNAVTRFDETVPVLAQPQQQKVSGSGISGTAQTAQESVPAMVDQAPPASVVPPAGVMGPGPGMMPPGAEIGAVPGQEQGPGGPTNPAQEGVIAAQEFLAPIMEAAMNGDQNAQMIIAQAAGNIARGIAEAANSAMQGGAAPAAGPGGAPAIGPDGMPVAPASPEEAVANQIVPEAAPAPAASGPPAPGGDKPPAPGGEKPPAEGGNPFAKKDEPPKSDAGAAQPAVKENSGKDAKPKDEKPGGTKNEDDKEFKKMSMDIKVVRQLLDLARAGKI